VANGTRPDDSNAKGHRPRGDKGRACAFNLKQVRVETKDSSGNSHIAEDAIYDRRLTIKKNSSVSQTRKVGSHGRTA
jgi:hypothetical protein